MTGSHHAGCRGHFIKPAPVPEHGPRPQAHLPGTGDLIFSTTRKNWSAKPEDSLHPDLRNTPTLSVFKSSLKTFLFRKAYQ
nr:hypothetical protein BaRGS_031864 [Batillaria attramentaria]